MKFSGKADNGPMKKRFNFGDDPDLDAGIVFRIFHYWEIQKVVAANCAVRRCSALQALAGIAIATVTSLRHWPLAEVCTVPVLLVILVFVWLGFSFPSYFRLGLFSLPLRIIAPRLFRDWKSFLSPIQRCQSMKSSCKSLVVKLTVSNWSGFLAILMPLNSCVTYLHV